MSLNKLEELKTYAASARNQVLGWLSRVDAEIIRAILVHQVESNIAGSIAEIGVHQGKCFVELCLSLQESQKGYCIDIFDAQHLNKDTSGRGDRAILEQNLAKFGVPVDSVVIDARPSQDVSPEDVRAAAGEVRFFSVDGGHWLEIVESDLDLAEATLSDLGVIALDDFHRPEWPDVSAGYFAWNARKTKPLVPFAIGFNKLYLCHIEQAAAYKSVLYKNPFLCALEGKRADFLGQEVPVYQKFMLPEWLPKEKVKGVIRTFAPALYAKHFSGHRVS
jgi:hypothetical protein